MNTLFNERIAPFEPIRPFAQLLIFIGYACLSYFFLVLFLLLLQSAGVVSLTSMFDLSNLNDPKVVSGLKLMQILSSFINFILPVFLFAFMASTKVFEYLGLNKTGKLSVILIAGLLMLAASPLINYLAEINSHLQLPAYMKGFEDWIKKTQGDADALTEAFIGHQSYRDLFVNLVMIALLPGLCEELFFRGVLQKLLIKMSNNVHLGVWLTGAIFSAFHLEFYGFLPRMLMGVYLGYLFVWTGSLWPGIFAHFLNNAASVLFAFLEERKIISDVVDKAGSQNSEYGYVLVSTGLVILLMFIIYRISRKHIVNNELSLRPLD